MAADGGATEAAQTVSGQLAAWAAALTPEDVPEAVRKAVSETCLDTVGLSIAAAGTDYGLAVRTAADAAGPCTVLGAPERRSAQDAALINGTTGHGEDFDNTFEGCPVHSGVVIVPALFAAGEASALPADRVALGMAVGMETMCRFGIVAQKAVHAAGFHPTAILGTVAAALGVGVARGLAARQLQDALGVAGSMAAGIIEYLADGSWTKRMHAGWAAQSGIKAAAMGAAGFRGPVSVIEGVHGLYAAFGPSIRPDYAVLTDGLGTRWEAANVAFKPYACGTMTQPFIDCAVRLARRGIRPEDVVSIECAVGEGTVHRLWEPLALKQRPPTPYAAKFSGPYTVAAGLVMRDAGLAAFTDAALADPQILALAGRVSYRIDPDDEYPRNYTGTLTVRLASGDVVTEHQPQLRGGTREPLGRADLVAKCAANLRFAGWQGLDADALAGFCDGLFSDDAPFSAAAMAAC